MDVSFLLKLIQDGRTIWRTSYETSRNLTLTNEKKNRKSKKIKKSTWHGSNVIHLAITIESTVISVTFYGE